MFSKFAKETEIKSSTNMIQQQLPKLTNKQIYSQIPELKTKYELIKSNMNDLDRFLIYPFMKDGENVCKFKIGELLAASLDILDTIKKIEMNCGSSNAINIDFHLLRIQSSGLVCRGFYNIYRYEEINQNEPDHLHKVIDAADHTLKYFVDMIKRNPKTKLSIQLLEELDFSLYMLSKYGKQLDDENRAEEKELAAEEKKRTGKEEGETESEEDEIIQENLFDKKMRQYNYKIFKHVQKYKGIAACHLLYPHFLDELKKDFSTAMLTKNIFLNECEQVAKYSPNVIDQLIANNYILKANLFTRNSSLQWGTYIILNDVEWLLDECEPIRFNQYLDYIRDELKANMLPVVEKLKSIEIYPFTQSACSLREWGFALADFSRYLTMNYDMMKYWLDEHEDLTDKELDKLNFMFESNLSLTLDVENLITQYEDNSPLMQELIQKENLSCKDEDDFQEVFDLIIERKDENVAKAKAARKNDKKCEDVFAAPLKPANRPRKQPVNISKNISTSQGVKKSDSEEELSIEEDLLLNQASEPKNAYYAELASLVINSKRLSDQAQKELRMIRANLFRHGDACKVPLRRKERTQIETDFEKVLQKSKKLREQFKEYQKLASENIDPFQSDSYEFEKTTIYNKIQAIKDEYKILHDKLKQNETMAVASLQKKIEEIGRQEFLKTKDENSKKYPDSPSNFSMDKKLRKKITDSIEQELNELDQTLPEILTSSQTFKCQ